MKTDDLYDAGVRWTIDREAGRERSQRRAWLVAGTATALALIEAVAMVLMMPLRTVQPIALLVDRTTGFVQTVDPSQPSRLSTDGALTRSMLAQYVAAREGYDRATVRADYRRVALWSAGAARAGYLATMPAGNPASPLNRYPASTVVDVRVASITPLSPRSALVRFETALTGDDGRRTNPRPWSAIIRFRFTDTPMAMEDRLVNPLGFQVTSYRRDAEAPVLPPVSVVAPGQAGS